MDAYKLAFKIFLADGIHPDLSTIVPVFHRWIQQKLVANHSLIDVADYDHVQNGPGVLLLADEGNFSLDLTDGKPGFLYVRKRPLNGTFAERIKAVIGITAAAAQMLQSDLPAMKFDPGHTVLMVNDRLLAPNDAATFAAVSAEAKPLLEKIFGGSLKIESGTDPLRVLTLKVSATPAPSIQTIVAASK